MPSNLDRALRGLRARSVLRDLMAVKSEYPSEFATRLIKDTCVKDTEIIWLAVSSIHHNSPQVRELHVKLACTLKEQNKMNTFKEPYLFDFCVCVLWGHSTVRKTFEF